MDDDDLYNLVDDRMYMAVITARHPTGAVRGQVYRLGGKKILCSY